jgi:stage V sporulation protein B
MRGRSFVAGAVILMAAGFVVRILGFVYRIFLSNVIGAEGMGLFQLISPVYSLIVLVLTSGISIAVSRMTAAELARNKNADLRRISNIAALIVFSAGTMASLLLYFNIDFITAGILKDSRTYYSLMLLIPAITFISVASAIRGYFYGTARVTPPAVSQIVEQAAKMTLVMLLAGAVVPMGLEYACALATAGMILGEMVNLLVLMPGYFRSGRGCKPLKIKGVALEIIKTSIPVSANRFVVSILSAVEFILIPAMLAHSGLDYQQSLETYGKLTGMALPLIYFPSLVTFSLATTLVPAISEASSLKNMRSLNNRTGKSIQMTMILGIFFTLIFMMFPDDISSMVYRKQDIGKLLFLLSFSCIFVYLQQILTGILNGLGKQGILLRNTIIGSAIRLATVYLLIPVYGIEVYIWGLTASFLLTDLLNLKAIHRVTGLVMDIGNWLLKPFAAGLVMVMITKACNIVLISMLPSTLLRFLVSSGAGAVGGFMVLYVTGVVNTEQLLKRAGLNRGHKRKGSRRRFKRQR